MNLLSFHKTGKETHGVKIIVLNESGLKLDLKFHELPYVLKDRYEDARKLMTEYLNADYGDFQNMCFDFKAEGEKNIIVSVKFEAMLNDFDSEVKISKLLINHSDSTQLIETARIKELATRKNDLIRAIKDLSEKVMEELPNITELNTNQLDISFNAN